jgi:transcriptional regulator with XRE-family HTH domain
MPTDNLNRAAVQALAEAKGINSTAELARRSGIDRPHLSRILAGQRTAQPSQVLAIAEALQVAPIAITAMAEAS